MYIYIHALFVLVCCILSSPHSLRAYKTNIGVRAMIMVFNATFNNISVISWPLKLAEPMYQHNNIKAPSNRNQMNFGFNYERTI